MNASGLLGEDELQLRDENVVDYHRWPEGSEAIAESLLRRGIIALTGVDCSDPAVRIAKVAERYRTPAVSYSANAASLSSPQEFPYFVRVVTPSSAYEGYLIDVVAHFGWTNSKSFGPDNLENRCFDRLAYRAIGSTQPEARDGENIAGLDLKHSNRIPE